MVGGLNGLRDRIPGVESADPLAFDDHSADYNTRLAFAVAKEAFEDAYDVPDDDGYQAAVAHAAAEGADTDVAQEISDDDRAVEYLEDFAVPLFRQYQGLKDTDGELDLDTWRDRIQQEYGTDVEADPDFHEDVTEEAYDAFYDEVQERYDPDEFDQIVGVYSSGLPFLYTASSHLDGDEVVLRYSYRREDDDVQVTDTMADRQDFDGADVLIVDDCIATGDTMQNVGEYVLDQGADSVTALVYRDRSTLFSSSTGSTELTVSRDDDGEVTLEKEGETIMDTVAEYVADVSQNLPGQ